MELELGKTEGKKKKKGKGCLILVLVVVILGVISAGLGKGGADNSGSSGSGSSPAGAASVSQPAETKPAASEPEDMTTGQRNALNSAKSYLRVSSFSRQGLVDQLAYEGYTTEEAEFAVDNCGADAGGLTAEKPARARCLFCLLPLQRGSVAKRCGKT